MSARSSAGAPAAKTASTRAPAVRAPAVRKAPAAAKPAPTRTTPAARTSNGASRGATTGGGDTQLRVQNEELAVQLQNMKESLESLEKVKHTYMPG